MKYLRNIIINIDNTIGSIIFGSPYGISISAWVGFKHPRSWAERAINTIMGSPTHCRDAIDWPVMRQYYEVTK